jgi:TolA-binding protein
LEEKHRLAAENDKLNKQLKEKADEVAVLSEQNVVYMNDFRLEREDRERTQSKLSEVEQQLMDASARVAELEDEKQQLQLTNMTLRHQVSASSQTHTGTRHSLPGSPATSRPHYVAPTTFNIIYQQDPTTRPHREHAYDHGYVHGGSRDVWDGESSTADTNQTELVTEVTQET